MSGHRSRVDTLANAVDRLRAVLDVSRALTTLDGEAELLALIASSACHCLGYAACAVSVRDEAGVFRYGASAGFSPEIEQQLRAVALPAEAFDALCAAARPIGSVLYIPAGHPVRAHPALGESVISTKSTGPQNGWQEGQWHPLDSLTVPLVDRAGQYIGLISVDQPYDRGFPDLIRIQALELFAGQCVVAVEQARLYEEMRRLAMTDALTGLPSRMLLHDRLQQAIVTAERTKSPLALLLMDLDRFKEVNDTLGHHYGDILLQGVAERIRSVMRAADTVARLGGDEFAVVLPATEIHGATRVATAILAALDASFTVDGHPLDIGASIGIALLPEHGTDAPTLLRRADVAMYVAKRSHGGYTVYSESLDHHSPQRLALMSMLRQSLDEQALELHYQPLVDFSSGVVTGVEALVRWQHPEHGFMKPDQFIPLAEHTGVIFPLTRWVLEAALRQCRDWQRAGLQLGVSVNLSARTLHDAQLLTTVAELLRRFAVPPHLLTIEITESALMADPGRSLDVLTRLSRGGVRVAIDDFGTGYSSLNHLKTLPVHEVKIDKSFVQRLGATADLRDSAIVRLVIAMARTLDLEVVAEGVETVVAWQLLQSLGCTTAQGYYLSPPLPARDLEHWLQDSPWEYRSTATMEAQSPA